VLSAEQFDISLRLRGQTSERPEGWQQLLSGILSRALPSPTHWTSAITLRATEWQPACLHCTHVRRDHVDHPTAPGHSEPATVNTVELASALQADAKPAHIPRRGGGTAGHSAEEHSARTAARTPAVDRASHASDRTFGRGLYKQENCFAIGNKTS
jgi:hypothetical protein